MNRQASILCTILITTNLLALPAMAEPAKRIHPRAGLWVVDSQTALMGHVVPDVGAIIRMGPQRLQTHVDNMLLQNHVRVRSDGTATVCVSEEQINSGVYVNDYGSGCLVSKARRNGNTLRFNVTCGAPKGQGQTVVQLQSATRWKATTQLELTVRGITQLVENRSYGQWAGAKCPAGQ